MEFQTFSGGRGLVLDPHFGHSHCRDPWSGEGGSLTPSVHVQGGSCTDGLNMIRMIKLFHKKNLSMEVLPGFAHVLVRFLSL